MRNNKRKILTIFLPILVISGAFLLTNTAHAGVTEGLLNLFNGLIEILISALGVILVLLIQGLVAVASFSTFIHADAVTNGWVIVRDLSNMFFVVALLVIAFATILRLESYSFKKWLPKLMLMAILINFSKTICGVLIDIAQIVMLTFVNAFKDIAGGNFVDMLGIHDTITLAEESDGENSHWTITGAYVLGLLYMVISIITILAMLMMLAMRIVMIWIYVVLSPLAYLLMALPGAQSYASQWWSRFIKNLIVGPVLAFFIWLSFVALQTDSGKIIVDEIGHEAVAGTVASTPGALIKFAIAIGMLVGGLKIAQEVGGEAGSMAGKGMNMLNKGQGMVFGGGTRLGKGLLRGAGAVIKRPIAYGVDKTHEKTGVDFNLKRVWGKIQEKRTEMKAERYGKGKLEAARRMEEGGRWNSMWAMTGNADDAWEQLTSWKGFQKRIFKSPKKMKEERESEIPEFDKATEELEEAKFQKQYMLADDDSRELLKGFLKEDIDMKELQISYAKEEGKEGADNKEYIADLEHSKKKLEERQAYVNDETKHKPKEDYTEGEINVAKERIKSAQRKITQTQAVIDEKTPEYNFEARAMEQQLVNTKMAKIKDISDPTELNRILKTAMQAHDKSLVKAVTLKMTKDYNDNEFLQPLAGDTGHKGLKKLMRDFATESSDNYAGFNEQEAFALGSQIAELNKATNHWAATSAYVMDHGRFRETTEEEHHRIRDIETGKVQMQAQARNFNRLAWGSHNKEGDFNMDQSGIMGLFNFDSVAGHKNISTMTESTAKRWHDAIKDSPILLKIFNKERTVEGKSLMGALKDRLGSVAESRFENKYSASLKVKKGEMPDDKAVISGAGDFIEKEKPSKKQQDKDQPERKKRTNKKVKKKTFPGVIRE